MLADHGFQPFGNAALVSCANTDDDPSKAADAACAFLGSAPSLTHVRLWHTLAARVSAATLSGTWILSINILRNTLWNHALVSTLTSTSLLAFVGVIGIRASLFHPILTACRSYIYAAELSELEIAYIGNKQTPFVSVRASSTPFSLKRQRVADFPQSYIRPP